MKKLRFPAWALLAAMTALLVLELCLPVRDYSPTEKRYLAKLPTVTWDALWQGDLSQEAEDYLADHFPFRNWFVGVNAYWNLLTGRNAAQSVYYCRDGYLIAAPSTAGTETLEKNVARFAAFAQKTGLPASLMPVPSAGYVMEAVLPQNHAPYRDDALFSLAESLCEDLRFIDLRQSLQTSAQTRQVFYKTDHHLTSAGCYTAYSAYSRALGREPRAQSSYQVSRYTGFHGTAWSSSGYWLTAADDVELWDAGDSLAITIQDPGEAELVSGSPFFTENLESDDMYTTFLDGNHAFVRIDNPNAQGGTLLILRDSYAQCLAPFLASDYARILLVDLRYYRQSVSQLVEDYGVTELLFVYGVDSLLTDTNSAWLD